jgi:hypothetical protein
VTDLTKSVTEKGTSVTDLFNSMTDMVHFMDRKEVWTADLIKMRVLTNFLGRARHSVHAAAGQSTRLMHLEQ